MSALRPSTAVPDPGHATALRLLVFAGGYLVLAWVSFVYPMTGVNITPWNPQAALAAGLLVVQPGAWPVVWAAAGIAEGFVGPDRMSFAALVTSTGALTAGYACTAAGFRRWLGPEPAAIGRRSVIAFLLLATGGALIASMLRAGALWALAVVPFARLPTVVYRGFVGDGVAFIVVLPVLLVLASARYRARSKGMFHSVEAWVVASVAVFATIAVFQRPVDDQFKVFYFLFLPVVWAAVRFGAIGAVWSAALVQVLLIAGVLAGQYQPLTVFELQVLTATLSSTGILLGAIVDEREAAEEALRASLRLAAAGDMAVALAHELNQPLTALGTYARASQVLARRLGDDAPGTQPLVDVAEKIALESTRAGEVVNRLRRFFRDRSTELQPTELHALISEALASQAARAREFDVQLSGPGEHLLPAVWVDPVQLAVVLRNLLANAIEAASAADAPDGAQRSVHVSAEESGSELVVRVIDSGPGLSREQVPTVFDTRASAKPGGMGIGLAISRSILEAHGGRLWAEPGPGGRFCFSIPMETGGVHGP